MFYLHNPGQQLSAVARDEFTSRLRLAFVSLEESVARGEIGVYGCATWDELRVPPETKGHVSLEEMVAIARDVAGNDHHFRAVQMPINFAMTEAMRVATQPLNGTLVPALIAAEELGLTVFASAPLLQAKLTSGLPAALADAFPGCTTDAQRALSFVRALPGVTAALVGTKTEEHIDENLAIARLSVTSRALFCSGLPVGDEQIQIAVLRRAAGRPNDLLSVRTEHRKAVELGMVGHLFESRSVRVDEIQLKIAAARILVVRRENDLAAVGREERSEVGAAEVRDLMLIGPVGVHDPDLHAIGPHQSLLE